MEPAHRVALRNLKDFAVPLYVKLQDQEKVFWRFYSFDSEKTSIQITKILKPTKRKAKKELPKTEVKLEKPTLAKPTLTLPSIKPELKENIEVANVVRPDIKIKEIKTQELKLQQPKIKKAKKNNEEFKFRVYNYLDVMGLSLVEKIDQDDIYCIASNKSTVGNINFLVIAKKKKKLNESDISYIYQQGQQKKMPVLLLVSGKLTKKAKEYLKTLGSHVIVNEF